MCTLHANSAREAVVKMCILPLLAGENIGTAFVVPTVASSVDLVVHVGTEVPGHHRVREIVAVSPTFQVAAAQRRRARPSGGGRPDGAHVRWTPVLARANQSAAQSANGPQDVRKPPTGADLDQRQRRSSRAQCGPSSQVAGGRN
jgi:hypothetical protein